MLVVGLTGGIGSGKSTFAALLAEHGAQVIDADLLAREAVRPGRPAWHSIVHQFGEEMLVEGSMELDRRRLARIVFADRDKLVALNAILHPVIFHGIADELDVWRNTDEVVVVDAPLMIETGLDSSVDVLIAVTADDAARKQRLVRDRAMSLDDIHARMRAQAAQEDVAKRADIVVDNGGPIEELAAAAARVWADLEARAQS